MRFAAQEILRWGAIVVFGGSGLWSLFEFGRCVFGMRWDRDWPDTLTVILVILVPLLFVAAACFSTAYLCLRRQYRKLFLVLGAVGSVALFIELMCLPNQVGLSQFLVRLTENHDLTFCTLPLLLPLSFAILLGPIYASAWFFGLCHRLAYSIASPRKPPKTRATRTLVWLGAGFVLLSLTITTTITLTTLHSPHPNHTPRVIANLAPPWHMDFGDWVLHDDSWPDFSAAYHQIERGGPLLPRPKERRLRT